MPGPLKTCEKYGPGPMTASCLIVMFTPGPGFEVRPEPDIKPVANFETERSREINKLLVSFDSEIRPETDIEIMRFRIRAH
jgi:hypothetical protein